MSVWRHGGMSDAGGIISPLVLADARRMLKLATECS